MIEPLRFSKEHAPPHIIDQAVFCGVCLADRKTRKNPKVASKYCHDCFKNNYMCLTCDSKEHGLMKTKDHVRSLLVVGPPVRKKVLTRGDATNFPMFLDEVKIKFKARIYDNGKLVNRVPSRYFEFLSGQSGDCIHVQVLGCKGLLAADAHGASDPFIAAVYCGVPLGMTRTRHRTVNPKWTNETYVIPCSADLPPPREESFSQKNLMRLEVYDRDYFTSNDFLGHIELSRKKLIDMAAYSNGQPLNLNLTARHHHGTISIRLGTNKDILYLRVVGGESLEKTDGFGLSDPFCKVYFKGRHVGTTPVCKNTVTPKWTKQNSFAVSLAEVLDEEERISKLLKQEELEARRGLRRGGLRPLLQSTGGSSRDVRAASTKAESQDETLRNEQIFDLNHRSLFVLELYDYNNFNPSQMLGHVRVPVETLRKLVPILPSETEPVPQGTSMQHMIFRAKSATGRFFRGEKISSRVSGKEWSNTPSAKGYNDATNSEKLDAEAQIEEDRFNSASRKLGIPSTNKNGGKHLNKQMSTLVGDISGVLLEEDDEEESVVSPPRTPIVATNNYTYNQNGTNNANINRNNDAIENVGISALLNQELEGGSSYASESLADDGSSITTYDPQGSAVTAGTGEKGGGSIGINSADNSKDDADLLVPQRQYSSLSNRPAAPQESTTVTTAADCGEGRGSREEGRGSREEGSGGGQYEHQEEANDGYVNDEHPGSPATHDDNSGLFGANDVTCEGSNDRGSGSGDGHDHSIGHSLEHNSLEHSTGHGSIGHGSVISASEKALDEMYSHQMEESDSSDEGISRGGSRSRSRGGSRSRSRSQHNSIDHDDDYLPEEMLEDHSNKNSQDSDGSDFDEHVPIDKMRDRGKGKIGKDGVFLEENEALLGSSSKKNSNGRRRSSLLQTITGSMGFASGDFGDEDEDNGSDGDKHNSQKSLKEKQSFANNMQKMDYNNSCFKAIKRAFFGEVRWSQVAYFPVVKYKLSDDDLDCNRGEITIRVLRSNRGKVLRGLDSGIRNMSLGETSQVKVRYDRAYSSFTLGTYIPPRANIVFTCELITINGKGKFGMPARQLRRIYRFFWRYKEKCVNKIERTYWDLKKRYNGVLTITQPPDSYYAQTDDEESFATSTDSWGGYIDDDEDNEKNNQALTGVHLGAKIMWGFQPERRPVKKKKIKTEYEKLLDRQKFLSEKKSMKAQLRKEQKLLMAQESALTEHDHLLNMGLGDNVDMDFQLGQASGSLSTGNNNDDTSSYKSLNGDGSLASHRQGQVDLNQNIITDDMAIVEVADDPMKLDINQVHGIEDDGSSKKSKNGKKSNKKEGKRSRKPSTYVVK